MNVPQPKEDNVVSKRAERQRESITSVKRTKLELLYRVQDGSPLCVRSTAVMDCCRCPASSFDTLTLFFCVCARARVVVLLFLLCTM